MYSKIVPAKDVKMKDKVLITKIWATVSIPAPDPSIYPLEEASSLVRNCSTDVPQRIADTLPIAVSLFTSPRSISPITNYFIGHNYHTSAFYPRRPVIFPGDDNVQFIRQIRERNT